MAYKQVSLATKLDEAAKGIAKLNVNLKLVRDVDGKPKVAQLVGYILEDIHVHGA
jgi:acetoacetate decarboxylase